MKHQDNCAELTSRLLKLPAILGLAVFLLGGAAARATTYYGNGATDFGGPIGEGSMALTDDGTNIYGTLTNGGSSGLNDVLVIYIDTGAGGGFSNTLNFSDQGDPTRHAISGLSADGRSEMVFTTGFNPQYAVALGPSVQGNNFGGVWKLANGGNESFPYQGSANLTPLNNNTGPYTFSFPASYLGLTTGVKATIKIFGTLISTNAYRSQEAIAGNDSGADGWSTFNQIDYGTYVFAPGPVVLSPVTFSVDMTEQIANGNFKPGNGDTVYAAGTFQATPWSGFQLTNGIGANSKIYTGTALDANPTTTPELYKFTYYSVANSNTVYEASDNRPFTLLQTNGQTLSLVYFGDLSPSPSATTNSVTFQVDMTPAIALGNYTNGTGSVEVFGTFGSPVQWAPGFILTNNPSGPNPNLYSGTTNDGNYPGSWEQYKFVIVGASDTYESIPNRDFTTPTNADTLPVAYFNDINDFVSVPVFFQVDMTSQVLAGNLVGNTVGAAGTFQSAQTAQQWVTGAGGFILTNNPHAANSNVYSGTYMVTQQADFVESYKFIINSNGTAVYELPGGTGGNNRQFVLTPPSQTLPLVDWGDLDPNDLLLEDTQVTFTINMAGAVDINGIPFNPSTDQVLINGSFLSPVDSPPDGGWNNELWTDAFPGYDYPAEGMTEINFTSTLYTNIFVIPAGSSLQVSYKYAIWHNVGTENTDCDNEAPPNENHSRYIRTLGAYSFPVDVFGQQTNSNPAIAAEANEASFGNLAISGPSAGTVAVSWLGRPGVYLQTNTNLASGVWTTALNSDLIGSTNGGGSVTNIPANGKGGVFYRLVNP